VKPRPTTILPDLIERTKAAAHELDNAVARRFERMLITVAGGDASTMESTLSLSVLDGLLAVSCTDSAVFDHVSSGRHLLGLVPVPLRSMACSARRPRPPGVP